MENTVKPTLSECAALRAEYGSIPLSIELPADMETPIRLLYRFAGHGERCFLLESVEGGEKWGRYSFLGFDPAAVVTVSHGKTTVSGAGGGPLPYGDPYEALRALMRPLRSPRLPGLPRFTGGLVGYFGYDMARYAETLPETARDDAGYPDASLMLVDRLVAFDHVAQTVVAIVHMPTAGDLAANYAAAEVKLRALARAAVSGGVEVPACVPVPAPVWQSNLTKAQFEGNVRRAQEYIRAGDIFQAVPSQRFTCRTAADFKSVYRALRRENPSPYLYYFAMDGVEIAGASPETLVRLENGVLETCPIAGTRPRGATPSEDAALENELRTDEKELAEHTMLVDLGRNDLGRVSEFGSVKVVQAFGIAKYSRVMHLTSLVQARMKPEFDAFDALRAVLPAGTLSGAPKVRAMQIIEELEPTRRGPYGGAIGYVGFDGSMDACIAIRTVTRRDGVAAVQAGAGIVADSVPESEYQESINKARAVFDAVEAACRGPA